MFPSIPEEAVPQSNYPVRCFPVYMAPQSIAFPMHWHNHVELLAMESGTLEVTCSEHSYVLKQGEIALFNTRQAHFGRTGDNSARYIVMMFDPNRLPGFTLYSPDPLLQIRRGRLFFDNHFQNGSIYDSIHFICSELRSPDAASELALAGELYKILAQLVRNHISSSPAVQSIDRRFEYVLNYLAEHFCEPVTMQQMAALFNYEEAYLCRKFKQLTGMTFTSYVRMLRMEKACAMFQAGRTDLRSVAPHCGYEDVNYFSRCFKDSMGISPSQWLARNRYKEGAASCSNPFVFPSELTAERPV